MIIISQYCGCEKTSVESLCMSVCVGAMADVWGQRTDPCTGPRAAANLWRRSFSPGIEKQQNYPTELALQYHVTAKDQVAIMHGHVHRHSSYVCIKLQFSCSNLVLFITFVAFSPTLSPVSTSLRTSALTCMSSVSLGSTRWLGVPVLSL